MVPARSVVAGATADAHASVDDEPSVAVAQLSAGDRLLTIVRLVHPFPSLLDGLVVVVVALAAGATFGDALTLGVSMTLLQFAIGTLNDLVDAPRDRGHRTGKPIADGLIPERIALVVFGACALGGLVAALRFGPGLWLVGAVGFAIGVWYDTRAKGTRLSWLPMALGVPLLPVFGWYGATGGLPSAFVFVVPAAALAGMALAIANAAVDIERDRAAGTASLAVSLGPMRATLLALGLECLVGGLAIVSCVRLGASGIWLEAAAAMAVVPVLGALLGCLVARRAPWGRELAFELQAVGLGLLAVAWVNALSAAMGT